jgi:hypothetical protein
MSKFIKLCTGEIVNADDIASVSEVKYVNNEHIVHIRFRTDRQPHNEKGQPADLAVLREQLLS